MAEELGFSRAHFNKLFLNGFKLKLQRTTVKKFKKYLTSNRQYISQLLKFDQRIMSQLTENETELLLEFLNSDGFSEEEKSNDINEVERDWKFYTFQALRLRDGEMKQETLAKEVGVSVATLGKYLNGKSTRLRRNTEIVLQKWVKAHSSKLLEHLCDEHLAKRAGLNDGDKPLLEEYLRTYLPKEPKFDSDHLEKLNSDFRPAIGIAAIKLASAADSNRGIAGEIGVLYENICNYTSGKTKRFNTEIEEKVRKWLFNNMNRLWAILQGGRYTHVLSSEESTILNEFLFKHKNYKPNKS
jgi:transcriptional regulator with XRE-family HTH domain